MVPALAFEGGGFDSTLESAFVSLFFFYGDYLFAIGWAFPFAAAAAFLTGAFLPLASTSSSALLSSSVDD